MTLAVVVPLTRDTTTPNAQEAGPWSGPAPAGATQRATHLTLHTILRSYGERYPNLTTRANVLNDLGALFRMAGVYEPADLTTGHIVIWATRTAANNSVRQHISVIRNFARWCVQEGHLPPGSEPDVSHLVKQHPKTYGKQQARHPARFLTRDQADLLLAACQDGTWVGSRDQLLVRLGLLGVRANEIVHLTFGALHPDDRLRWIGKSNRARCVTPGPNLLALLPRWERYAAAHLGRPVLPTDRLLPSFGSHLADAAPTGWRPMNTRGVFRAVTRRAALAGLGHVTPHDLRRTAASILHADVTPDGAHRFDLLDIQRVLDHADPVTTQRCYLTPLDTGTKDRAGIALD